ncbi:hypothetical protein [Vibrio sp. SCSIO 43137]|uniref:hypothetical protein n=1 Tax=Vibrio sp. SCSIO 43137 TaxID=3021011 RepID=UPI002307E556|nr:hypothetical protein [Vibrio sp. SCSIO 43137]WCE30100.1 hypothetical protein PK654_02040 [Vibrio sp. SCSIO 43137]
MKKEYYLNRNEKRTVLGVTDIRYSSADQTTIDCEIAFAEFQFESLPYTADKFDCEAMGRELFNDLNNGVYGEVSPYVEPEPVEQSE